MEIFTSGVSILKSLITIIGGGMVIIGLVQLLQGQGDNNAAQKQTGIALFVAGAGVAVIGQTLVPMLANIGI